MTAKHPLHTLFVSLILVSVFTACSLPGVSENNTLASSSTSTNLEESTSAANTGAQGAKNDQALTTEDMLIYAIQDEYLARAEYDYILSTFGDRKPFNNIIKAEEKHIALLTPLFKTYSTEIPQDKAKDSVPHPTSIEEALNTGVQAEIDNIAMYDRFLSLELPDDIKAVFTELRDASKSHLSAFQKGTSK